ncbi:MAG: hypothetical protein ABIM89_04630 [Mycobacteriales bacterium]
MPAVQCPKCESDDIDAVGKNSAGDLMLRCEACGTQWTRTPNRPCPNCAAIDVTHTDAAGYLCRGCGHSWRDIPVVAATPPVKAVRSRTTRPAVTRPVSGGAAHRLDAVWSQLETHAGEPFTLKRGQDFTYHVSGAVLMPTTANWDVPKAEFAEALRRMPVSGPAALKDLQAAAYIYALLHDPRISSVFQ